MLFLKMLIDAESQLKYTRAVFGAEFIVHNLLRYGHKKSGMFFGLRHTFRFFDPLYLFLRAWEI